jgi:LPXTG-motif cell wall-anchored protein
MRRSSLRSLLVATFAASALITSTASARPTDRVDRFASPTSSLAGTSESNLDAKQDLRGEHAQDAARLAAQAQVDRGQQTRKAYFLRRQPTQDLRGEYARDAARGIQTTDAPIWSYTYQAPKPSPKPVAVSAPRSTGDSDDIWLVLGIALGASAIVGGTALVFTRRSRVHIPA